MKERIPKGEVWAVELHWSYDEFSEWKIDHLFTNPSDALIRATEYCDDYGFIYIFEGGTYENSESCVRARKIEVFGYDH